MNRERWKHTLLIIVTAVVLIAGITVIGTRIYLHVHFSKMYDFREYALSHGPWGAGKSVWVSDGKQAYLISENKNIDEIADVTACFYSNGTWYFYRMMLTWDNRLALLDEENSVRISGQTDFDKKNGDLIISHLDLSNEQTLTLKDVYVFSRAAECDETVIQLPI